MIEVILVAVIVGLLFSIKRKVNKIKREILGRKR